MGGSLIIKTHFLTENYFEKLILVTDPQHENFKNFGLISLTHTSCGILTSKWMTRTAILISHPFYFYFWPVIVRGIYLPQKSLSPDHKTKKLTPDQTTASKITEKFVSYIIFGAKWSNFFSCLALINIDYLDISDQNLKLEKSENYQCARRYEPATWNLYLHGLTYVAIIITSGYLHYGQLMTILNKSVYFTKINGNKQMIISMSQADKIKILISFVSTFAGVASIVSVLIENGYRNFNQAVSLFALLEWIFIFTNIFTIFKVSEPAKDQVVSLNLQVEQSVNVQNCKLGSINTNKLKSQ